VSGGLKNLDMWLKVFFGRSFDDFTFVSLHYVVFAVADSLWQVSG
jgi:hypothetical protein